ncbi:MAG TPA: 6-bladed beta-propeller [Draconibacterium sp.]|nr:6-bladed beta-propeller [Draconibacterium sp.]
MKTIKAQSFLSNTICLSKLMSTLVILFYLVSCNESKQNDDNSLLTFDITNLNKTEEVKASEVGIIDIEYIPLETTAESAIAYIRDVQKDESSYYIKTDNENIASEKFTRFDLKGNFIAQLGRRGGGPQEYKGINDFSIGADGNIYILSINDKKIYVYTNTGDFVRVIDTPTPTTFYIECIDDGIICYSMDYRTSLPHILHILNYDGNVIKKLPNRFQSSEPSFGAYPCKGALYKNEGKIYLKEPFTDTVFCLNESDMTMEPAFAMDRGGLTPTKEEYGRIRNKRPKTLIDVRLLNFGDNIYLEFVDENNNDIPFGYFSSFDKSRQYLMNIKEVGLIDDIDGGPTIWMQSVLNNTTVIAWIDAISLIEHVSSAAFRNSNPKYPEKKKELEELVKGMDLYSNPVLMLLKFEE